MQFTITTLLAASAALLPAVSGHVYISQPKMFANHKQNEGFVLDPLDPSGADFPCQNGTPDDVVPPGNALQLGQKAPLVFEGTAVHGGGSGQMVITYDFPPPKDINKWRVLTSYEGGHPVDNGDQNFAEGSGKKAPATTYTVWEFLPQGKATVAWMWFNKIGNREHYMKCATVSIGGSSEILSGQMESDALKKLPTPFRANSNGCTLSTAEAASLKFNNPGNDVRGTGTMTSACDKTIAGTAGNRGSGGSSSGGSGSSVKEPATPVSSAAPSVSKPANKDKNNENANNGDVKVPAPTSAAPAAPKPTTAKPAPSAAPVFSPSKPVVSDGGACEEGKIVCNADGTWSQCGSGIMQNMGPTAAGMACVDSKMVLASKVKRNAPRFSALHRHRRRHN